MKIRHLVERKGARGSLHYWQPSAELRAEGWNPLRLPDDPAQAAARAEALNRQVDAWRRGEEAAEAPAPRRARAKGPAAGTVSALIAEYRESRWWAEKAPATRQQYGWALGLIEAWAGDVPTRAITPRAVQAFYEAHLERREGRGRAARLVRTPARAAALIRVLRLLLQVGQRLGYQLHEGRNPALRPGVSVERQREPRLWPREAVKHMVAVADRLGWRSVGTAIVLNDWLGQRLGDLLALPPWGGGPLVIQQSKTRRLVSLPVHQVPHLVARLKEDEARQVVVPLRRGEGEEKPVLLRHDRTGRAWTRHTFAHVFAEIRAAAAAGLPADEARGLPALPGMPACDGLIFMELRHTAVTRQAEAGSDPLAIAAITGHSEGSVRAILERHYLIRTAGLAEATFARRLKAEGEAP
jgi:hypothetical protein